MHASIFYRPSRYSQSHTAVCYSWAIKTMQRAEPWHSQRCSQIMLHRLKTCRSFPGWHKLLIHPISHVAQMLVTVTIQKHLYETALIDLFHEGKKKKKVNLISELHERHSVWAAASTQNPSVDSIVQTCSNSQQTHSEHLQVPDRGNRAGDFLPTTGNLLIHWETSIRRCFSQNAAGY